MKSLLSLDEPGGMEYRSNVYYRKQTCCWEELRNMRLLAQIHKTACLKSILKM